MKNFLTKGIVLVGMIVGVQTVWAADSDQNNPPKTDTVKKAELDAGKWSGKAQFGGVSNTGNTETKSANGGFTLDYTKKRWTNSFVSAMQISTDSDGLSSRNYDLNDEANYHFSKNNFIYGLGDLNIDTFSSYEYFATYSSGYGRRVLDKNNLTLDLKAGPGGTRYKERASGDTDNEFVGYFAGNLAWNINQNVDFTQSVSTTVGGSDVYTKAVSALNTKLIGNLGLQLSYTVKHHSDIPSDSSDTKHTDTISAITLVYAFGKGN